MNSTETSPEMKAAILLHSLTDGIGDDEAIAETLSAINGERADKIRSLVTSFKNDPIDDGLVEAVLEEFETFFRFAVETANVPDSWMTMQIEQAGKKSQSSAQQEGESGVTAQAGPVLARFEDDEPEEDVPPPPKPKPRTFRPTDDPLYDLKRLSPTQVAGALAGEHPRSAAIVLMQLDKDTVANIIQELPEEMQSEVFMQIKMQPVAPPELLGMMLETTVACGAKIEVEKEVEPDINQQMADLLRSISKERRAIIMEEIRARDTETADAVAALLYVFEDVSAYEDRSIQRLLGEVDTSTLVIALQDADQEITDRILGNLSKRARQSLEEELELAQKKSPDEVAEARKGVAEVIGKLDQAGQLTLIDG